MSLTGLLGHFSDHLEFAFAQDQTEGDQLYQRLGLIGGLVGDLGSPFVVPFDFCFEHQNLTFHFDRTLHTQLYNRLGLADDLVAVSVIPSGRLPYIAIRLGVGTTIT